MADLINMILGHREAEERMMRDAWERTRFQTITLSNTSGKLKKALKTSDLPFPWDKAKTSKLTEEDWAFIDEGVNRMFLKQHTPETWEARGKKDFELEQNIKKLNG